MHRTLPATEQIQQVDTRVRNLKESVIENIKDSQILRSNFTTMMHTNKEVNERLNSDILDVIAEIRSELFNNNKIEEDNIKDIEKELSSLNLEKRIVNDGILLLNKRVMEIEEEFGCFQPEETLDLDLTSS